MGDTDDTTAETEEHDHPHHVVANVSFGVVTVSSSRTLDADESGDAIVSLVESEGMDVGARELVGDDKEEIRETVLELVDDGDVDAIVTTGGTGLSPADVTVESLRPHFDREIPGFGELFRTRSDEEIGPRALLSRACAGVIEDVPVFCLPGSRSGASFGTEELILPTIGHIVGHTTGKS